MIFRTQVEGEVEALRKKATEAGERVAAIWAGPEPDAFQAEFWSGRRQSFDVAADRLERLLAESEGEQQPRVCKTCGASDPADLRELEHWEGPDEEDCTRFPCPDPFHNPVPVVSSEQHGEREEE